GRAGQTGRQRHALSVVARRKRHDTPRTLFAGQREQFVERATDLERAGALEVLALEEYRMPGALVERPAADDQRTMDSSLQPRGRASDLLERQPARLHRHAPRISSSLRILNPTLTLTWHWLTCPFPTTPPTSVT